MKKRYSFPVKAILLFAVSFLFAFAASAQAEKEPNNDFANANLTSFTGTATGSVCNGDVDYFKIVLPSDGTVRVHIEATNIGGNTASFHTAAYDQQQNNGPLFNITPAYYVGAGSLSVQDADAYCRSAGDTIYVAVWQDNECFSYKLSFSMVGASTPNDTEPNNSFTQSIRFNLGDTLRGHIGHVSGTGVSDDADYYKTVVPSDGVYRVYMEATNTGSNIGNMYVSAFDQRKDNGVMYNRTVAYYSNPGQISIDSVDLYCRAAGDTLYFRVTQSSMCYSYKIMYKKVSSPTDNDAEANNSFDQATSFKMGDTAKGHIGYVVAGDVADNADFFKTVLPKDGKYRVVMEATNTGDGTGNMYVTAFDQRRDNGVLFNRTPAYYTGPGQLIIDSIDLYCRAAGDTVYFRVMQSGQCYGYKITYKLIGSPSDNDLEPNNNFNQAIAFAESDSVKGHIGYVAAGDVADNLDFYKTVVPRDGVVRVYMQAENTGDGAGNLYVTAFDQRRENGVLFNRTPAYYTGPGQISIDSLDVYGRSANDTIYFRVTQSSQCYNYKLRYKVISPNINNDAEPNNTMAQATYFKSGDVMQGHIGYATGSATDGEDHYKTLLPTAGTIKVKIEATNTGDGAGNLYMTLFDSQKNVIANRTSAYYSGPGQVILDSFTISCRGIDTTFFQVTYSGNPYVYKFSYEMLSANNGVSDPEPNDAFETATVINAGDTVKGNVGLYAGGNRDSYDYFVTKIPYKGTVRVWLETTNNTDGSGNLYFTGFDKNRNVMFNHNPAYYSGAGQVSTDNVTLYCQEAENFYFRINSDACFSYKLRYVVTLGRDTTVHACSGCTTDISKLYDVTPFSSVTYENLAAVGTPVDPTAVKAGSYRLTVFNGTDACSRDTAIISVTTGQVILFDSIPDKVYGAAPFAVKATSSEGLPVTYKVLTGPATISGNMVTVTGVGSVTIRAEQAGNGSVNYAFADRTFNVGKATATITLSNLTKVYDGQPVAPKAVTNPASLTVTFTFNGAPGAPVNAGAYGLVATVNDAHYSGSATDTVRIQKAPQTISLTPVPDQAYSSQPFNVAAGATSGLPVALSLVTTPTGIASISGNTITLSGLGTVIVNATQSGNTNYNAAPAVADTFVVSKGSQTITFTAIPDKYIGDTVKLNATASSSLAVTYSMVTTPSTGVARLSRDTIYLNGTTGSITVTATQAGTSNYNSASAQNTFKVLGKQQTITFNALPNKIYGDAPFAVKATTSSGLPVSFRIVSGPATMSNDIITLTGDGTVTVEASQAGSSIYSAAIPVQQSFTVTRKYPDLVVQNVTSTVTTLGPNDSATVNWSIGNVGNLTAMTDWTERIYMQSSAGENRTLLKEVSYKMADSVLVNKTVARSTQVGLPSLMNIGDNGVFVVEVVPGATVQEAPVSQTNNVGLQAASWVVKKILSLELSTAQITEGDAGGTTAKISRTGSLTSALTVNLALTNTARFSFPSTITIPAGQVSQYVTVTAVNNSLVEGTKTDSLRISATGFSGAKANLTILDDDKPTLTFTLLPTQATEGQTVTFKVNTDMTLTQPLTVYLTSKNQARFPLPPSVTIPAGVKSADVTVALVQDQVPEIDVPVNIIAAADNHNSANATITVKDDDIPGLELVLQTNMVSEAAGYYATKATLRRAAGSPSFAFTANLTTNVPNTLILPASVSLAQGENEKTFDVGVVDNTLVDGNRNIGITASIYVNSCGCSAPSTSAGTVTTTLTVTDNDGPALTVSASKLTLLEGLPNAGLLRITRNTATTSALTVNLTSSNTAEATVPATATIAAGQTYIEVPITTIDDKIADGNKQVYFQATAANFSSGSVWVMVSDQNKPDLQIPAVKLGSSSVQAMGIFNYQVTLMNSGFATAPGGVVVRGYLSSDDVIDEGDSLISEDVVSDGIPAGGSTQVVNAVKIPNMPGTFKVLYIVNPEAALTELLTTNNTSVPTTLTILPDYSATAVVQNAWYLKGTTIPVTGTATRSNGSAAANEKVEVYVMVNGLRRTVLATTDATGKFTTQFVPLSNEAGHYSVGASFPGLGATAEQDAFDILGVKINAGDVPQFKVIIKDSLKGTLPVLNMSNTSLTKFSLVPVTLPNGATMRFDTVAVLAGNATVNLGYKITGAAVSPGSNFEVAALKAVAQEATIQDVKAYYYCKAPNAYIDASISNMTVKTSATAGEKVVQFTVANKGMGETGDINVLLPQAAWINSITPVKLPSLASGDTAVVALKFLATQDVPFDYPVNGNIVLNTQNGNAVSIPFSFEKVSQSTGTLKIIATDQFTYYSAAAPKVKGAHVVIKNYYTGQVYADGYTDTSGVLMATNVPEGRHRITVEKEQHQPYSSTVTVDPGRTVEETVFLNYQAITFSWNVVPTAVQDQYDITLETKFETNVPVPVVTIDMPKTMPKLSGTETYAFNVILTNHGLITAKEVQLGLPTDDPEYEFITNYTPSDLIAQQSIEVPVIMRRRGTGSTGRTGLNVQGVSQFLGMDASQYRTAAAAAANGSGNCQGFTSVAYWYKCNFTTGLWEKGGELFTYQSRSCTAPPGSYGGVPVDVGGIPTSDDGGYNDVPCAECGPGGALLSIPNNAPPTPNEKKSCKKCIDEIKGMFGCAGPPSWGDAGKCAVKNIKEGAEWTEYIECLPIPMPPQVACLRQFNKAADACAGVGVAGRVAAFGRTTKITGVSPLGAAFDLIAANMKKVERSLSLKDAWLKEYYGNMTGSDAMTRLASYLQTSVTKIDSIRQGKQDSVLAAMAGYELQADSIRAFFTRWNTSVAAYKKGVLAPNSTYPAIVNWTAAKMYSDSLVLLQNDAVAQGYESVEDMWVKEYKSLQDFVEQQQNAVCASVTMQLSQRLTMTREAFEGTLDIFNGHPTDKMDSITINIKITDVNGAPANQLFDISTKTLTNLANVTGTGNIASQQTGSVKFLFIPSINAAPTTPQVYNFGGSITYWDPYAQGMVTMPLAPIPMTVNPSPNLMLHYFMQRNILGDDPLTSPDIEPSVPAELAVMVENQGYGPAVNMTISSAQPKITDNEKGLAINFNLIGSNFQGQPKKLGVTDINFGTVPALQARIGQWYFTSSLLGKFVGYDAKVVHSNSFGNPDMSLVKGVKLHELTKSIKLYGTGLDDGINDFLVNDIFDVKDVPDVIYYSQGMKTTKVVEAASGSFSAPVAPPTFTNTLTVTPSAAGWNYIKLDDPGKRLYDIASVKRSDGQVIPLDNAWLTFVTLPAGQAPKYENKFHFVDTFSTVSPVTYTVVWKPRNTDIPKVDTITGAPKEVTATQVQTLTMKFNKAIDPATFTYADMTLTLQGGQNIMNNTAVIKQVDTATFTVDLTNLTKANGFYAFTVQAANVADVYGVNGQVGKQVTWTQSLNAPVVQSFLGIPDSRVAKSYDKIQTLFNLPIDVATITSARFTVLKNGMAQAGTITVDSVRTDHKLFYLSGLKNILTQTGVYEFKVDLPNIKSETGVAGAQTQSIFLTVDNTGPIVTLEKSSAGALDVQHVPYINLAFNEGVDGLNTASFTLTRNGQVLPLTYDQLSMTDAKTWMAGNFGMLTYPDGAYTFTVNMAGVKDSTGNVGVSTKQISWTVDRTSVVGITNLAITPDKGYSATDGVTSEQSVNVMFTLARDASQVVVYQYDPSGQTVLASRNNVNAGTVSIPVTFAAGSNTGVRVTAVGATGGQGTAEKTIFIDQVPLSGLWNMAQNQPLTRQMDTVAITLSDKLLSNAGFITALKLKRNGATLPTSSLTYRAVNDTLYEVRGLRSISTAVGDYELSLDLQQLSKYTSGKTGNAAVALNWSILSTNRAPLAKAGKDTTITQAGVVKLDGTGSTDPDGDILMYRWVAPQGITLSDTTSSTPTFTATQAMQGNTYPFLLVVNDGSAISTSRVNVNIRYCGVEVCNGIDDDCDGLIDEGFQITYYKDNDGDGFGTASETVVASQCAPPAGYASQAGDCNDNNPDVYPGSNGDGCSACATDGVTFYSGIGNTYQWQVDDGTGFKNIQDNSIYSGTTLRYLVLTQPPTSWYGYKYRCVITNNGVQSFTPERVLKFTFSWKGSVSSAWENPLNWSCNKVPDGNTDVKVDIATPVVISSAASVRSIMLSPNSKVTVTKGATLQVKK
jgi:hypothetical protein